IGDEGALALARVLPDTRLTRLSLALNRIGPEGARTVAGALPETVTEVSLWGNKIGSELCDELRVQLGGRIALAVSELPAEFIESHGLTWRVFARGGEGEVRFLLRYPERLLPVWHEGELRLARWGCRRGESKVLPCTAWTWVASIEEGKWSHVEAALVEIPAAVLLKQLGQGRAVAAAGTFQKGLVLVGIIWHGNSLIRIPGRGGELYTAPGGFSWGAGGDVRGHSPAAAGRQWGQRGQPGPEARRAGV